MLLLLEFLSNVKLLKILQAQREVDSITCLV
uniref:Uncharacterized protein n=1 Tax=Rhizophora mucronata TaxID=61149 RepID=A0A2P2KCQ8_RHIMU